MKIRFEKAKMLEKLVRAMGAVSSKNTHPFTEGVLLETAGDRLKLSTYDMEKSVRASIEAEILIEGGCVINAQRLLSIVRILPENEITMTVDDELLVTIQKMLSKTAHSIAQIDQRPVLCGAFFKLEPDNIKVVTCDSYTLSVCDYKTPVLSMIENLERTSFIVPGKTVAELSKMLSDEEGQFLTIMVTAKNIIFNMENLVFSSRLVEGEYIDYDRLIPKDQPIEAIMDAAAFTAALERAALISEERIAGTAKNYVKLTLKDGIMQVSSRSANGNIIEEVPAEQTGDEIVIGFNCRYLIDTMRAIESEKVRVKLITPFTSVTFEPVEDEEKDDRYLYMVLPLRMKE